MSVDVIGNVMESDKKSIKKYYSKRLLKPFLKKEIIDSIGDFALVDSSDDYTRIVTAPGFSGGWIRLTDHCIQHNLSNLINSESTLNGDVVRHLFQTDLTRLPPFKSPISDVFRLRPGCIITISEGNIEYQTYLDLYSEVPIKNLTETLSRIVNNFPQDSVLAFSGGVDSTLFALAADKVDKLEEIQPVFIDYMEETNTYEKAQATADAYGIDLKTISYDKWLPADDNLLDYICRALATDLSKAGSPYFAIKHEMNPEYIISGQNIDSVFKMDMSNKVGTGSVLKRATNLPTYLIPVYLAYVGLDNTLPNIQYTDVYTNSSRFRRVYDRTVPLLINTAARLDPTDRITTEENIEKYSDMVGNKGLFAEHLQNTGDLFYEEFSQFNTFTKSVSDADQRKLWNHLIYASNAVHNLQTEGGSNVLLPAMWGPILQAGLVKEKLLKNAFMPKYEVYNTVKDIMGVSFHDTIYEKQKRYARNDSITTNEWRKKTEGCPLLQRELSLLMPENSVFVHRLPERDQNFAKTRLKQVVNSIESGNTTRADRKTGYRALNLELLIR